MTTPLAYTQEEYDNCISMVCCSIISLLSGSHASYMRLGKKFNNHFTQN